MFSKKVKQIGAWSKDGKNSAFALIAIIVIVFMVSISFLAIFTFNANAWDGDKTIIYGNVEDKYTGEAINEAEITIYKKGENRTYTTYTDKNGTYSQEIDDSGNYTVIAEKEGYTSEDKHVYVEKNEHVKVDFKLEKDEEKTILNGYTKENDSGEHITHVFIKILKNNFSKETKSNDKGYYEFELEEGGWYDLRAEKDGYKDYEDEIYVEEGKENTHNIYMEKESSGNETKIYGYVNDKDSGEAINDVEIFIHKYDGKNYTTSTNNEGYYEQIVEEEGNYSVVAEKEGYKRQEKHAYVQKGKHTRVDFNLEKEGGGQTILQGYTKEKDSGEHITHVNIKIMKDNFSKETKSNDKGYYKFELEEGGWYDIRAEKDGYKDYEDEVYVEEGKENTHNIHMEKEGSGNETWIYGHVKEKGNGEPINEAKVTIKKDENHTYKVYTNNEGYYEKQLEHGGEYTVIAEKEGYKSEDKRVYIKEGEENRVDFELEKEGGEKTIIRGHIKDKDTNEPINEAHIKLFSQDCNCSYEDYSDKEGYYYIELGHGGNYSIRVEREGYKVIEDELYIKDGDEKELNIHLEKDGSDETWIVGHVKEKGSDDPIVEAEVTIKYNENHTYTVYTNEKGYYEKQLEHGGKYKIKTEKKGYKTEDVNITIEKGEKKKVDRYLEKEGSDETWIFGHVKEKGSDEPIIEAEVIIKYNENHTYTVYTNEKGYYEKQLEHDGNYKLIAEKEGYKTEDASVTIEKGDEKQVDFYLEKEGSEETWIFGYVKDKDTSEPINDAKITIEHEVMEFIITIYTNMDGKYEKKVNHYGNYTIIAEKDGYKTEDAYVHVKSGEEKQVDFNLEKIESKVYGVNLECKYNQKIIDYGEKATYEIVVENTGDSRDLIKLSVHGIPKGWNTELGTDSVELDPGKSNIVKLIVVAPNNNNFTNEAVIKVIGTSVGDNQKSDSIVTITTIKIEEQDDFGWIVKIETDKESYKDGDEINCTITIIRDDNLATVFEGELKLIIINENNEVVLDEFREIRITPGGEYTTNFNFILNYGNYTVKAKLTGPTSEEVKEITIFIGNKDGEEGIIPGFDTVAVATAISMGALVAFFRRRD